MAGVQILGIILLLGAVGLIIGAVSVLQRKKNNTLSQVLGDWSQGLDAKSRPQVLDLETIELSTPLALRLSHLLMGPISPILQRFVPANYTASQQKLIDNAGNPWELTVERLVALQVGSSFVAAIVGFLLVLLGILSPLSMILLGQSAVVGGLIGFFLPSLYLRDLKARRLKSVRQALPNWLDVIAITVRAGSSFDMAVSHMSAKSRGPLIEEFDRYLKERQLGLPMRDALQHLQDRNASPELLSLMSTVILANQLGTPLGIVLKEQAKEQRIKKRQFAEQKAQQAPIKMLFPMILFIFPSIFVIVLGPSVPTILHGLG